MSNIRTAINDSVNGTTFISLTTSTIPRLTGGKKNPHQGKVRKIMTGANVMIFQNKNSNGYENMVKRRLLAEGKDPQTFELSARKWGTRIPNSPFVEHKGNYYLEVIFLKSGEVHYTLDGVIESELGIEGLPPTSNGDQGGLSDKVVIRTFKVESIESLTIAGETFDNLTYIV